MSWNPSNPWSDPVHCHEFDFLPPVDDSIFDEILSTSVDHDSTSSDPPSSGPKRRRRTRTYRTELLSLHETKAELEKAVQDLEQRRRERATTLSRSERKWEQIARNQLELKLKVLRENEELRAAVKEQHQLSLELEAIVCKKPRSMMDDDKWRVLKLSAHAEKRLAAIHLIANRQLDMIESEMITTGLMCATDKTFIVRPSRSTGPDLFVEGMTCVHFPNPTYAVANAAWKALNHIHANAKSSNLPSRVHSFAIDQDTVFIRVAFQAVDGPTKVESCVILKKQLVHGNHFRMVFRTVLDDEADPFDEDSFVSDLFGWIDIEQTEDGATTQYKSFAKAKLLLNPRRNDTSTAEVLALIESLHFDERAPFTLSDENPTKLSELIFRASNATFLDLLEAYLQAESGSE
ncbi:hypothetical protein DYB32_009386 [Aphanomyces invadans]|uniref:Uncharacterized protein n=1 Tax=Aphanomyces invadans TaxID=157072 RepID=A0A418AIT8_9STRA|nr:hypothetical protein DYB32_009386 [Aphanomyces invadans]